MSPVVPLLPAALKPSRIAEIDQELRVQIARLVGGDKSAMDDVVRLTAERTEQFAPACFGRKDD